MFSRQILYVIEFSLLCAVKWLILFFHLFLTLGRDRPSQQKYCKGEGVWGRECLHGCDIINLLALREARNFLLYLGMIQFSTLAHWLIKSDKTQPFPHAFIRGWGSMLWAADKIVRGNLSKRLWPPFYGGDQSIAGFKLRIVLSASLSMCAK